MNKSINFYILNRGNKAVAVLSTEEVGDHLPVISAKVEEKLSSYDILTISIPADAEGSELVKEEYTIIFEDIKGWREYVITEIEDVDGDNVTKTITAELSSVELLDEIIETELTGYNDPTALLTAILNKTRWSVGTVDASIYNSTFSESVQYKSVLEIIDLISSAFNCEVSFSYTIDQNKVSKRFVNLSKQVGSGKGKRFEVDKDVTEIVRTVDTTGIKTAIIPYGKEPSEATEGETQAKRLDIKNVVWSKVNGDPVDKPKGQSWIGDPQALANWGKLQADGTRRHRFIALEIETETEAELATMAWVNLGKYTDPSVTYEAKVMDLYTLTGDEEFRHEHVFIGDTVAVIDNYFADPITVKSRVVELVRDLIEPLNNEVVLGDSKQTFKVGNVEKAVEELATKVAKANYNATNAVVNGAGNTTFYGTGAPPDPDKGDTWFRPHPDKPNETQLVIYNGTVWEVVVDTSELEEVKELTDQASLESAKAVKDANEAVANADKAVNTADTAISKAEQAINTSDQAVQNAGFAQVDANVAKGNASTALTTAETARVNAEKATKSSATALTNAESALATAGTAQTKAETAISTASTAKEISESAEAMANTAKTNASTAIATANTAKTNAGNALATAQTAIDRVGTVEEETGELKTSYDSLTQTVGLKADQTTVSGISNTVTQQGLNISANAKAVGLKADKSVVDTINQTVASHTLSIKATADSLATKAEKSLVDSLNGTVATHTTAIKVNADGLALKADKTLVDSVRKTVDTHSTQISATAEGLALKADKTLVDSVKSTVDSHSTELTATAEGLALKADQTAVDSVNRTVATHTADIQATADGLALKADKTLVDTVKKTVDTHTTSIKATSDGLALKAEKTAVDSIKSTVDSHTTQIKATSDGLALKADSSTVNAIKGTVDSHSTQISANSTAINARLTSAQVDSLVAGKKYVNETTLNATANGLSTQITQVSTDLDNLEISGRNLLRNSDLASAKKHWNETGGHSILIDTLSAYQGNTSFRIVSTNVGGSSSHISTRLTVTPVEREKIIVNFYARAVEGETLLHVEMNGGLGAKDVRLTTTWQKFSIVFEYTALPIVHFWLKGVGAFLLNSPKAEQGNKATSWSQAPEDLATLEKFTTLEATVNGINTVVGNKADQSQITQLAGQINSKVATSDFDAVKKRVATAESSITQQSGLIASKVTQAEIDTAVNGISVGGTNLIPYTKNNGNVAEKYGDFAVMYALSPTTSTKDTYMFATPVLTELEYTVSFFAKSSTASSFINYFYSPNTTISAITSGGNTGIAGDGAVSLSVTTSWKRYWITWKQSSSGSAKTVILGRVSGGKDVSIAGVKFESGNKASDWSPAPEDVESRLITAESSITQQAGLIQAKVSTADYNSKISQIDSAIMSRVTSNTYNSKMTQLDKSITSVVTDLSSLEIGGRNLVPNSGGNPQSLKGWVAGSGGEMSVNTHGFWRESKENMFLLHNTATTAQEATASSDIFFIQPSAVYTFSFWVFHDSNLTDFDVYVLGRAKGETAGYTIAISKMGNTASSGGVTLFTWTFTTPSNIESAVLRIDHNGRKNLGGGSTLYFTNIKLEKGNKATDWTPAPEDMATASQITQLSSDINLRVTKNDVVNQINVSSEGILIDGKKVHITGTTKIDNAVISSAMIKEIKADLITAGTLNASNVNIINLNADSITAGILKGTNLSLNLGTGDVLFQKGVIKRSDNLFGMDITKGRFESYNSRGGITLEDGSLKMYKTPMFIDSNSTGTYYGSIDYEYQLFGGRGLSISGTNGAMLKTASFNTPLASRPTGAGIVVEGTQSKVISQDTTVITGGAQVPAPIISMPPSINVGATYSDITKVGPDISAHAGGYGFKVQSSSTSYRMNFLGNGELSLTNSLEQKYFKMAPATVLGGASATFELGGDSLQQYSDSAGFYIRSTTIYNRTTSASSNTFISSNGTLARSTSASKYKLNISEIPDIEDYSAKILELKPKQWFDKLAVETRVKEIETGGSSIDDIPLTPFYGLIAEDLVDLGLTKYVSYGMPKEDGAREVEGIMYDRLWTLLIPVVKDLKDTVTGLEKELADLKGLA